jgi:hypothetical protein
MYCNEIFILPKIILNNFHCICYFMRRYVIRFTAQAETIAARLLMGPFIQEHHV